MSIEKASSAPSIRVKPAGDVEYAENYTDEEQYAPKSGGVAMTIGLANSSVAQDVTATFYNQDTGEALRITDADANKKFKDEETKEEMIARFRRTPPEELFKVDKVKIELSKGDMPGKPYTTAFCSVCGEKVSDGRHLLRGGKPVCKSCAEGSYYELIED
jgi:formylmethanofuran dehydrogenase subunit E